MCEEEGRKIVAEELDFDKGFSQTPEWISGKSSFAEILKIEEANSSGGFNYVGSRRL
jgi:hypothetical protein